MAMRRAEAMADEPARTAVVLLNMGGPLRMGDIRPFLLSLFNDRDIIRLGPAWLQPLIARCIVGSRWKAVTSRYHEIGGGSPILRECAAQAGALRKALREAGRSEPVKLIFRYASPRARGELRVLQNQGIRRLLPVSLYPHACRATTGSSLRELAREAEALGLELLPGITSYATDPDYLDALEDRIRQSMSNSPSAALVFSAHGLPLRQIQAGDPYERELHATVDALKARLGPIPGGCHLAYQSKVGPMAWLGPSLETVLKGLAGRDVVVCPLSFTGEHIETLHELDIHYRALAQQIGIQSYARVPAPGLHPAFIRCLARQTLGALEEDRTGN